MSISKVVNFPGPSLIDIPGQLRLLADWCEENPEIAVKCVALVGDGEEGSYPAVYGYGQIVNTADIVYLLEKGKINMLAPAEEDDG